MHNGIVQFQEVSRFNSMGPMVYINALFISYTDHDLLHHRLRSAVVGSALRKLFVVVFVFVVVYMKVSLRKQCFL